MKGNRIFDRFGFNLPKLTTENLHHTRILDEFKKWEYNLNLRDWQNINTGEILCGYSMPSKLDTILTLNLNDSIS
jgi:hypothetical protein